MQHANYASDIIAKMPGFRIVGTGSKAKVVDARGQAFNTLCPANIVVDGARYFEINNVPPVEARSKRIRRGRSLRWNTVPPAAA
jgi:outer membrane receptor for ferrienterochelin and colicin